MTMNRTKWSFGNVQNGLSTIHKKLLCHWFLHNIFINTKHTINISICGKLSDFKKIYPKTFRCLASCKGKPMRLMNNMKSKNCVLWRLLKKGVSDRGGFFQSNKESRLTSKVSKQITKVFSFYIPDSLIYLDQVLLTQQANYFYCMN